MGISQLRARAVENNGVQAETIEERQRQGEIVELVGKDGTTNPAKSGRNPCDGSVVRSNSTHLSTANLASGSTPPDEAFEDDVKMRRYRSTSCRDPRE
jgi:hypothetical protein